MLPRNSSGLRAGPHKDSFADALLELLSSGLSLALGALLEGPSQTLTHTAHTAEAETQSPPRERAELTMMEGGLRVQRFWRKDAAADEGSFTRMVAGL